MPSSKKSELNHDPLGDASNGNVLLRFPAWVNVRMSAVFIYRQIAFQLSSLQHFDVLFLKINAHYDFIIEIASLPRVTSKLVYT